MQTPLQIVYVIWVKGITCKMDMERMETIAKALAAITMAAIIDEAAHGAQVTSRVVWSTGKQQDVKDEIEHTGKTGK